MLKVIQNGASRQSVIDATHPYDLLLLGTPTPSFLKSPRPEYFGKAWATERLIFARTWATHEDANLDYRHQRHLEPPVVVKFDPRGPVGFPEFPTLCGCVWVEDRLQKFATFRTSQLQAVYADGTLRNYDNEA
jgi:hypothetical protein